MPFIVEMSLGKVEDLGIKYGVNLRIVVYFCRFVVSSLYPFLLSSSPHHAPACPHLVTFLCIFLVLCETLLQCLIHRNVLSSDYFRVKFLICIVNEHYYYLVSLKYHLCLRIYGKSICLLQCLTRTTADTVTCPVSVLVWLSLQLLWNVTAFEHPLYIGT